MIILHAGKIDGRFAAWGEASAESRPRRGARRTADSAGEPLPFGAGAATLGRIVKEIAPDCTASGRTGKAVIWLPTAAGVPVPSSEIIAERPEQGETSLAPWLVAILFLHTGEVVKLLRAIGGKRMAAPGVIAGADLACWSDVLRLAGSVVARQQFLPGVEADREVYGDPRQQIDSRAGRWLPAVEEHEKYRAVWNPVPLEEDVKRLDSIADRLPWSGLALSYCGEKAPPEKSPGAVAGQVLADMVDNLVRSSCSVPAERTDKSQYRESIHDHWLHALTSKSGKVTGSQDTHHLARRVTEWRRPMAMSMDSPYRLCFRLEEPDGESGGGWYMRCLLQSKRDPSLVIPTEDFWEGRVRAPGGEGRGMKEFLLVSMGQASGISPSVAAGLESGLAGTALDTAGAYRFLTEEAAALEQAGYGIMLPAWWTARRRISIRAGIKNYRMRAGSSIPMERVFEFNWEAALGDDRITLDELEGLAEMKAHLVRVRGQWMEAGGGEIRSAIKFLRSGPRRGTLRDIVMMEAGGAGEHAGLDVGIGYAPDSVERMLERLGGGAKLERMDPPKGFDGTLRPYQVHGYSWLAFLQEWGLGGCLADDMGLGKTVQVLALIQRYRESGHGRPVLLICPMSVIENWRKEVARFTPGLSAMVHHGASRSSGARFAQEAEGHALVISSYGLAHRDAPSLKAVKWGGIVLDEAQNIKNPDTRQAQAVRLLDGGFRFALTGTPVENSVGDLWSIMEFLNPGFLGSRAQFERNFFVPIQARRDRRAAERLKRATGPFVLRRLKTDKSVITDLPDKMEMKVYCTLTREQASLYSSVLGEAEREIASSEGIKRRGAILGVLSKLKQVCNHPAHFLKDNSAVPGRSGKLARLTEMLAEVVEAGDRALIFTQFAEMGHILRRHAQETFGLEVPFLHGGVPRAHRDRMIERFQDGGGGPGIFVLSLKAGGTGLNLTAASHVFHFDRWWNPAVEDQATDRAFRIGQTRNVQVRKLVCSGTLEERIDDMMERKKQVSEEVVGTGEGWLTELSNDDLKKVLALSREAAVM